MLSGIFAACSSNFNELTQSENDLSNAGNTRAVEPAVIQEDSLALIAIFNATNGKNWVGKTHWLHSPVDQWEGVKTAVVNGKRRVVKLNLGNMNLRGNLPEEIGNLTELKWINLSANWYLSGKIPESFYKLTQLEVWKMQYTIITGELSPAIGNLTKLDTLDLWTSNYEMLDNYNHINFPDPKDPSYFDYQKPNKYKLSGNLPKEIGKLKNLRYLDLGKQGFSGQLPVEMAQMDKLNYLDISDCCFTEGIPAAFGQMKSIETLLASGNQFTASIPEEICNAETLREVYIADNQIEGQLPRNIGKLKNLRSLDVQNNKLSGTIPASLAQNLQLGLLYLNNNKLSGQIPVEIAHERCRLTFANFSNNNLIGSLPEFPGNPYLLQYSDERWYPVIEARGNKLSGKLPWHYIRWTHIAKNALLPQQNGFGFENLK